MTEVIGVFDNHSDAKKAIENRIKEEMSPPDSKAKSLSEYFMGDGNKHDEFVMIVRHPGKEPFPVEYYKILTLEMK